MDLLLLLLQKTLVGLFFAITIAAIVVSKRRHGKKYKLPPGPIPFPIIGNLLQVGYDLKHPNFVHYAKKFGDLISFRLGKRLLVVVSSPKLARQVLHTQGIAFASRASNVVFDILSGKEQDLVVTQYGEHWRKMRRIATITKKVVEKYSSKWEDEVAYVIIEGIKKDAEQAATDGIVLRNKLELMMYNNLYTLMFDRRFEGDDDPLFSEVQFVHSEMGKLITGNFEYNYGDFISNLSPSSKRISNICKHVRKRRLQLYKGYVDQRNIAKDNLRCGIDFVIEAQHNGEINEENVLSMIGNINIAGMDTIVTTIEWGIVELVNHPKIQKKLRDEMDNILGFGVQVTESDITQLPYLQAVVKETLRLRMPAPLLVARMNLHEAELDTYNVPANSKVVVNAWWLANNPAHWKKPEEFRPERFLEEESMVEVYGNDLRYIPFGAGRRSCPGTIIAFPIIGITLGRLVQNFELFPPPGELKLDSRENNDPLGLGLLKHSTVVMKSRFD